MRPWYAVQPRQLDGLRVATVADPVAVSRAWASELLTDAAEPGPPKSPPGAGLTRVPPPEAQRGDLPVGAVRTLPASARRLRAIAAGDPDPDDPAVQRLLTILRRFDQPKAPGGRFSERVLKGRPQAVVEAVEILIRRPDAVRAVLTRFGYTDPATIGGYLDRDLQKFRVFWRPRALPELLRAARSAKAEHRSRKFAVDAYHFAACSVFASMGDRHSTHFRRRERASSARRQDELPSEPLSLERKIHRQARQPKDRHVVPAETFAKDLRAYWAYPSEAELETVEAQDRFSIRLGNGEEGLEAPLS